MNSETSISKLEENRKQFPDAIKKELPIRGDYYVAKDKTSQSKDAVGNVLTLEAIDGEHKFVFSVNVTHSGSNDPAVAEQLAAVQKSVSVFLSSLHEKL